MARMALAAMVAISALGACSTPRTDRQSHGPQAVPAPAVAQAELRDPVGRMLARAAASQVGDALRVRLEAAGLPAGVYGAHIHTTGRCDAPAFESAGAHWNPSNRQHGRDNPNGQHRGDLPNLLVGTDGRGSFEFTIPGASLTGGSNAPLLDGDGAAIVVHQRPDDYRTDPSGNSGARIACGVLGCAWREGRRARRSRGELRSAGAPHDCHSLRLPRQHLPLTAGRGGAPARGRAAEP